MLIAFNAILVLQRGTTVREIPLQDYYLDYRKTALQTGEFLLAVRVPLPAEGALVAIHKVSKRMDDDISAVCGAFHLNIEDGRVSSVRIAYGGMAAIPRRASKAETVLQGNLFDEDSVRHAQRALAEDFNPLSDARASAGYRLQVAQNLLYRVWVDAVKPEVATHVANYVANYVEKHVSR
jgi:xanthine dehydrogenase small subunit